ncbi:hypothetical protein BU16DRAFT_609541 [Lophium mytilinum]|uniref:Myb-like domain-containing protein n=1 Tax=Lophium mytilinum TaxID=390894 RepID=A0A6A6QVE1_9PEZI|nr:hypothetical protein BU16DRAFT_609541 [Lophium mytilinum]
MDLALHSLDPDLGVKMRGSSSISSASSSHRKTLPRDSPDSTTPQPQDTHSSLEPAIETQNMQGTEEPFSFSPTAIGEDYGAWIAPNIEKFVRSGNVGPVEQAEAGVLAQQIRPEDTIPESEVMTWGVGPVVSDAKNESENQEGSGGQNNSLKTIPIPMPRDLPTTLLDVGINNSEHLIPIVPFTQAEANRVFEFWAQNVWSDSDITIAFNFYCAGERMGIHNPPDFVSEEVPCRSEAEVGWVLDQVTWRTHFAAAFAALSVSATTALAVPGTDSPEPTSDVASLTVEPPQSSIVSPALSTAATPQIDTVVPAPPTTEAPHTSGKSKKRGKKEDTDPPAIESSSKPTNSKKRKRMSTNTTEDPPTVAVPAPRQRSSRLAVVQNPTPAITPTDSSPEPNAKAQGTRPKRPARACVKPPNATDGKYTDIERAYLLKLVTDDPGMVGPALTRRFNERFPDRQRTVKSVSGRMNDWKELKEIRKSAAKGVRNIKEDEDSEDL